MNHLYLINYNESTNYLKRNLFYKSYVTNLFLLWSIGGWKLLIFDVISEIQNDKLKQIRLFKLMTLNK